MLAKLKEADKSEQEKQKKAIVDLLAGEAKLRSKKDLIEKIINANLIQVKNSEDVEKAFEIYWDAERQTAFDMLCSEEGLMPDKLQEVIGNYLYTERKPNSDDVLQILKEKPKMLEKKSIVERVTAKILNFVTTIY